MVYLWGRFIDADISQGKENFCKYLVKSDPVWRKSNKKKSGLKLAAVERSNKKHMA
jgi:hypothetical protein